MTQQLLAFRSTLTSASEDRGSRTRDCSDSSTEQTLELSCLVGEVRHRRLRPVQHQFAYRGFFFRMDAALLDPLLSSEAMQSRLSPGHSDSTDKAGTASLSLFRMPLFAINRRALISMHAKDHGCGAPGESLSQWLLGLLDSHQVPRPERIRLLAYPRVLGYQFKPVSFWLCEDRKGDCLAIVAEVHNTFSERHAYVLTASQIESPKASTRLEGPGGQYRTAGQTAKAVDLPAVVKDGQTLTTDKCFTVSPFCTISGSYRFRFYNSNERSLARIEYLDPEGLLLTTSMCGERSALTRQSLLKLALGIPWQSLMVMLRIHWQALRLWLKKVPFYGADQTPIPPQSFPSQGT